MLQTISCDTKIFSRICSHFHDEMPFGFLFAPPSNMSGLLFLLRRLQTSVSEDDRAGFLADVYADQCVVSCVFQQLGDLEKTFIIRMLLLDRPLKEQLFKFLTVPPPVGLNPKQFYEPPLHTLTSLGIFTLLPSSQDDPSYSLNSSFRSSLISTIDQAGVGPTSGILTFLPGSTNMTVGDESKWHGLLERTISPAQSEMEALTDMDKVILRLGFGIEPRPPAAYKFVLADVNIQLWTLLNEFALLIERERVGLLGMSEVIKTVAGVMVAVSLSSSTLLGVSAQAGHIAKRTIVFLSEMDAIRNPSKANPFQKPVSWLGPTAAALHLPSKIGKSRPDDLLLGSRLIVDSNMHVTAYTRSNLQRQLISMFCEIHRQIGTVINGVLTRASVQAAIDSGGVSSESIIKFLSANLHPSCGDKLPTNVALQIRLWEADCPRNRMRLEPCVLFTWRSDRSEQASSAITQLRMVAEAQKALLFHKQDPDGSVYLGIKTDVAKSLLAHR
jgi:hypothetical protein